jgi:signal transduction histidine kinase
MEAGMEEPSNKGQRARGWSVAVGTIIVGASISAVIGIVFVLRLGRAEDQVVARYLENVVTTERLRSAAERESAGARAFLLTRDPVSLEGSHTGRVGFAAHIAALRRQTLSIEEELLLDRVEATGDLYRASLDRSIAKALGNASDDGVRSDLEANVVPVKRELDDLLVRLASQAAHEASVAQQTALEGRSRAVRILAVAGALAVALAGALGVLLRRALSGLARERAQLAASLGRVEQSNRDLDEFAGRVAHDLRNALAPAVMGVELLRSSTPSPERLKGITEKLHRANGRAVAVIDALLAFSRASDHTGDEGTCFIDDVLSDVVDQLAGAILQADVTIERSAANVEVRFPPGLLHVVLVNLVGNAVKYVRGCSRRVVTVMTGADGAGCHIRIEDTGPGIPVALRERVFEPFFRVPGVKAPGTGIGLATVRRIVEAHGGRVVVSSSSSGGAAVFVWLPQANTPVDVTRHRAALPKGSVAH